jgi:ATP/maltotriose-dependent transcriptional regulator MalT
MDVEKILAEMRLERDQLEDAIASLERLEMPAKRRGRPPAWLAETRKAQTRDDEARGRKKKSSGNNQPPG